LAYENLGKPLVALFKMKKIISALLLVLGGLPPMQTAKFHGTGNSLRESNPWAELVEP